MEKEINKEKSLIILNEYISKRWEKYDISEVSQLLSCIWNYSEKNNENLEELLKQINKSFYSSLKMRPKGWVKLAKTYSINDGFDDYMNNCFEDDKDLMFQTIFYDEKLIKDLSLPNIMKENNVSGLSPLTILVTQLNQYISTIYTYKNNNENNKKKEVKM